MQLRNSVAAWLSAPRTSTWLVLTLVLIAVIAVIAPQMFGITI